MDWDTFRPKWRTKRDGSGLIREICCCCCLDGFKSKGLGRQPWNCVFRQLVILVCNSGKMSGSGCDKGKIDRFEGHHTDQSLVLSDGRTRPITNSQLYGLADLERQEEV